MIRPMTEPTSRRGASPAAEIHVRAFRSPADYELLAAVFEASKAADGLERTRSAAEFESSYRTFGLDPDQASFVAEAGELGVGYVVGIDDGQVADIGRRLFHIGLVHPDFRGRGIGRTLLAHNRARFRGRVAPDVTDAKLVTDLFETQTAAISLVRHLGYEPIRYSTMMVRPDLEKILPATLPPGITSRAIKPSDVGAVHAAMVEAMGDEWSFVPMTEAQLASSLEHRLFGQTHIWQVAWDGDEVVGGVLGWIDDAENAEYDRLRGYAERIFVRRPWRGRGIASALIGQTLELFRARGLTNAALGVDTENPSGAFRLYERHGFRPDRQITTWARPLDDPGASNGRGSPS